MALLLKGKKTDLCKLAAELGLKISTNDKVIELRENTGKCTLFKEGLEFVKGKEKGGREQKEVE